MDIGFTEINNSSKKGSFMKDGLIINGIDVEEFVDEMDSQELTKLIEIIYMKTATSLEIALDSTDEGDADSIEEIEVLIESLKKAKHSFAQTLKIFDF